MAANEATVPRMALRPLDANMDRAGGRRKRVWTEQQQQERAELKETYTVLLQDLKARDTLRRQWKEGGHYRRVLGLDRAARSKEVVQAVRAKVRLWSPESLNTFAKKCHAMHLLPSPKLPWPEADSQAVLKLWQDMKEDVKERVAAAERERQQQRQPEEEEEEEEEVEGVPLIEQLLPPQPVNPSCGVHGAISGVFVGVPVTAVPVQNERREVAWPQLLLWNEAYTGNLLGVRALVKAQPELLDELGYVKTKPTAETAVPQRLGIKDSVVLPAPPGADSRASALHFAVAGGCVDVVRWLLKKGASPHLPTQQGCSTLSLSANPHIKKELLKRQGGEQQGVLRRLAGIFAH